jgi:uncharacterized iron-regulated membrane protein
MLGGEVTEGYMREVTDEMQVANDRQPRRRWRELHLVGEFVAVAAAAAATTAA